MSTHFTDVCRVLVADDIHPIFFDALKNTSYVFDYQPEITYEEAFKLIPEYGGLILRSKFNVQRPFFDRAINLKFIGRAGAGVDNIDADYARDKGVALLSAPEGNCDAVAEHMLGMLLALFNKIRVSDAEIRSQIWQREENRGIELGGKTVGLIGYGHNGKAMARKLSSFGVTLLAYDKYLYDFSDAYAKQASLKELFKEADVISLHIPLTAETQQWIDDTFFIQFQKPIFFLNGSRGEIVVIDALLRALNTGRIRGAALDVLPVERFPQLADTPWYADLIGRSNVLLSPHVAGWSVESYYKIAYILSQKIRALR